MHTPTVSVIMVTYNYGRFIREALDSLLCQTYQDFEVIVVDDGSTDDTAAAVRPYLNRVTYLPREHRGHIPGRKEGIRVSRGRYLCFFDADDICTPEKLELQVSFMGAHPEVDFVFSDFCYFDDTGVLTPSFMAKQERFQRVPYRREGVHRLLLDSLAQAYLYENFIFPGTMLVRRDYVLRVGVFDDSFEARVFRGKLLHTIGDAKVAYTDKVLAKRRVHRGMLTRQPLIINRWDIELYRRLLEQRFRTFKFRERLFIRRNISKSHWRLGCALVLDSRVSEGRHNFWRSVMSWPLQRRGYAGLLATFLPNKTRLVGALRRRLRP